MLDFFQPKQFPYSGLGLDVFHENKLRGSAVSVPVLTCGSPRGPHLGEIVKLQQLDVSFYKFNQ